LDRARASHGGLVLITGEPGIGKTRLVAEVLHQARGFTTLWSWCVSDPAGSSFRPWLQVVRDLAAADTDVAHLVAASPQLVGLISHQLPAGDARGTDETVRWQFFDTVAAVLRAAAANTPVLIVLDDVHAAQESSMWLLPHLAAGLHSSAVLVLATARDGEHAWHGHVEARAALVRQATSLHLLPVSEQHIRELLVQVTDTPQPDVLAERIRARTGGNPLLVSELIRAPREEPAQDSSVFGATVSASVRAITAERLVGCSSACQHPVSVAAVLGTRFGLDALADIAEVDLGAVREAFIDAETIGIREFPEPGTGRFVHELIRDAAYDRLSSAERRRWHAADGIGSDDLRAARAERRPGGDRASSVVGRTARRQRGG